MIKKWKASGQYWLNDSNQLHRVCGPAAIMNSGSRYWFLNGTKHRVGGPAIILADGTEMWVTHGQIHRIDGPAITGPGGDEYWIADTPLTKEEFYKRGFDEFN